MIGIIALLLGYPFHMSYLGWRILGIVDRSASGRCSCSCRCCSRSPAPPKYVGLFAAAVEAKQRKREGTG